MIYFRFKFPANRYHSTPWGSHVNEGAVDWPPSPWRLLRALISVGFTHKNWGEHVPDGFISIVDLLAGQHPSYSIPQTILTHTRHYMPVHEGKNVKSAKVLDTCVRLPDDAALWMRYNVVLSPEQAEMLGELTVNLPYLGRAESWVDAKVLTKCDADLSWEEPTTETHASRDSVIHRVLSPTDSKEYLRWRTEQLERAFSAETDKRGKKLTATQRRNVERIYPVTVTDCLLRSTSSLQKDGWSQPPGSAWIDYRLSMKSSGSTQRLRPRRAEESRMRPTTALLELCSESVRGSTLPPFSSSVFVGEALHKASISKLGQTENEHAKIVLTGKDFEGNFVNGHQHVHFLPLSLGNHRRINYVLVHSPAGFCRESQDAIASVDSIYAAKLPKTQVTLLGFDTITRVAEEIVRTHAGSSSLFTGSRRFSSLTPFVASKHLRRTYQLEQNVADECQYRGLPQPTIIRRKRNEGRFRLARIGTGKQPPKGEGWFLELEFPEVLHDMPLTLGYGSHFGLGQFAAAK